MESNLDLENLAIGCRLGGGGWAFRKKQRLSSSSRSFSWLGNLESVISRWLGIKDRSRVLSTSNPIYE